MNTRQLNLIIGALGAFFILIPVQSLAADARFISQLVPESVSAGQSFTVVLQYRNTSGGQWRNTDGTALKPVKSSHWSTAQIGMQEKAVKRGEIATFQASLKAPSKAGNYSFQWQIRNVRQGWNGPKSPKINIQVKQEDPAWQSEFLIQKLPKMQKGNEYFAILKRGEVYPVTIIFKNRGTKDWTEKDIKLALKHRMDAATWSITQVPMKKHEIVAPGEVKAFHFNIIAPLSPGIYPFQWQLKHDSDWFGNPSEKVTITVQ